MESTGVILQRVQLGVVVMCTVFENSFQKRTINKLLSVLEWGLGVFIPLSNVTSQPQISLFFKFNSNIKTKANRNDAIRQGKILFVSREIVYFIACIVK